MATPAARRPAAPTRRARHASDRRAAPAPGIVETVGRRARGLRQARGLTLRALASRAGLSLRFLMDVEAGRGNISVRRLADLAQALDTTPADLVTADTAPPPPVIALLGLRGAGKTTVGRRLARRLRIRFVELDREIERRAGLALGEIFSLHGEDFYRQLEADALRDLLDRQAPMVLAAGGGLVTSPETYAMLRARATTIWLRARTEDYWTRVMRQGDRRPMDQHPRAREALRDLVTRREPLYGQADAIVDTARLSVADTVARVEHVVRPNA